MNNLPKGVANPGDWDQYDFIHSPKHPDEPVEIKCWHTWLRYVGFREVYDYCMHCSEKREVPK